MPGLSLRLPPLFCHGPSLSRASIKQARADKGRWIEFDVDFRASSGLQEGRSAEKADTRGGIFETHLESEQGTYKEDVSLQAHTGSGDWRNSSPSISN